ncbi:MAG TPA: aminotransferase class III-fold pyridoxal phosphate-dependent enzyme, partial [Ktedonobacteraceae bacterium]|nr:aminotransferase class III-fold pyridoxal phosphate-dependent enzyme [Ktedonobacteraceae bacterium]
MDICGSERSGLEIAIIGMACRVPGAETLDQFWQLLHDGIETIRPLTDQEILACGIDPSLLQHPDYVKAASVLNGVENFDAEFFGYSAKEAEIMDPQARIFLECAWEALEHAGYCAENQRVIGVYAGSSGNSYLQNNLRSRPDLTHMVSEYQLILANGRDFLPTRVSYKLNLRGPGVNVQTGCSTSLVAVHTACQSLLNGECDIALAGGICIVVPQKGGYLYQEGGIHSPDGHCRAFDAQSAGTISGSGAGIVVLKRLESALEDGDTIYAIIKGSAINNDGSAKVSFTAPSVEGQARVIRDAHLVANVSANSISYVEAHGTGTQLGDPIEFKALTRAFRASSDDKSFCSLGSVKTNIGHLDTAAGVIGLIKTVLALQHRQIPPSLHFQQPNPAIDIINSPFSINAQLTSWPTREGVRRAGVSSFGIGGTNAHVILEEAPGSTTLDECATDSQSWHLLVFSARTATALKQTTANLATYLKNCSDQSLSNVAYTLQVGRKAFAYKGMVVCQTLEEAQQALENAHIQLHHQELKDRPVIFLFPGQGAQYLEMAQGLYEGEPVFRKHVDDCARLLLPILNMDLREILYPSPQKREEMQALINQTAFTQPALFTIEYALAQLWMSWGVRPQAMIGHSIGEYVAACLAGVFSLESALVLTAVRGKLMQSLPAGSMLAVSLSEEQLVPLLDEPLSLAAVNGPERCVVSGPTEAIEALASVLMQQGIACRKLHTSHAFHSSMMEPILESFAEQVSAVPLNRPTIPYLSNVSGNWITAEEATDPRYWVRHLRQTVHFSDGMTTLFSHYTDGNFLEVGPGQTLSTLLKQHPSRHGQAVFSSLSHPRDRQPDRRMLLTTLGQLWLYGVTIQWPALYNHSRRQRIPLPTYPFERKRYWIDARTTSRGESSDAKILSASPQSPTNTLKEHTMITDQHNEAIHSARVEHLLSALKKLFSGLLSLDADQIQPETSFFEIGADSLFLLQANQAIRNQFQVAIPFRAMLDDLSTFGSLAQRIDQELPVDSPVFAPLLRASEAQAAQARVHDSGVNGVRLCQGHDPRNNDESQSFPTIEVGNDLTNLMAQQLQIISKQLEVLGQRSINPDPPKSSAPGEKRAASPSRASKDQKNEPQQHQAAGQNEDAIYRALQKRSSTSFTPRQQAHVDALIRRLEQRTGQSKQFTQQYRPYLADNRASAGFRQPLKEIVYPLIEQRGQGARLWDRDGNEYVDLAMGFGALLFGHSPEFIIQTLEEQIHWGIRLGPQSQLAGKVAQLICELTGNERAAFCNSGTEAVMTAIRLARAVTGRT